MSMTTGLRRHLLGHRDLRLDTDCDILDGLGYSSRTVRCRRPGHGAAGHRPRDPGPPVRPVIAVAGVLLAVDGPPPPRGHADRKYGDEPHHPVTQPQMVQPRARSPSGFVSWSISLVVEPYSVDDLYFESVLDDHEVDEARPATSMEGQETELAVRIGPAHRPAVPGREFEDDQDLVENGPERRRAAERPGRRRRRIRARWPPTRRPYPGSPRVVRRRGRARRRCARPRVARCGRSAGGRPAARRCLASAQARPGPR